MLVSNPGLSLANIKSSVKADVESFSFFKTIASFAIGFLFRS